MHSRSYDAIIRFKIFSFAKLSVKTEDDRCCISAHSTIHGSNKIKLVNFMTLSYTSILGSRLIQS